MSVHNSREKGLSGPTTRVLADMTSFLETLLPCEHPLFLMGHSMGGAEVLLYSAQGPRKVRGAIRGYLLESPFIALAPKSRPYGITVTMGRLAGRMFPRSHMVNALDKKLLCRDPSVVEQFAEDKLCHDTGTLEGLAGMLDRAAVLETGKVKVPKDAGEGGNTRIWLSHGTADGICDFNATQKLYNDLDSAIHDKELKLYQGWYHRRKFLYPSTRHNFDLITDSTF